MDAKALNAIFSMPGLMTNPLSAAQHMYEFGVDWHRRRGGGDGGGQRPPIDPRSMQDPMARLGSQYDMGSVGKSFNAGNEGRPNPMLEGRPDSGDVNSFVSALLGQISPGGL